MEEFDRMVASGEDKEGRIHLLRHSKAGYKSYADAVGSEDPDRPFALREQVLPDITEAGVKLAREEAEKLFSRMNPSEDELFFVSSNQARALETAKIYKDFAKEKGFTILIPEHHRNPLAERMDEGDIRVLSALSLKSGSPLWGSIYNPPAYMPDINWEAVDPEMKKKWDEARLIIMEHDYGNWGGNFYHYSDVLREKDLLPENEDTARNLFDTQFRQLKRLAKFGAEKVEGDVGSKRIQVIAIGHENYLSEALERYFGEEGINNCEVIGIDAEQEGIITLTRRGESAVLPEE